MLSPLAWGLDHKGAEAILRREFAPGMKDGMPVNVRAQVEVNFRLLNAPDPRRNSNGLCTLLPLRISKPPI